MATLPSSAVHEAGLAAVRGGRCERGLTDRVGAGTREATTPRLGKSAWRSPAIGADVKRIPLKTAAEYDVLTTWRRFYTQRAGVTAGIKRQYRRRERRMAKREISDERRS